MCPGVRISVFLYITHISLMMKVKRRAFCFSKKLSMKFSLIQRLQLNVIFTGFLLRWGRVEGLGVKIYYFYTTKARGVSFEMDP